MKKRILHVIWSGNLGGSETLLLRVLQKMVGNSQFEHHICMMNGTGPLLDRMKELGCLVITFRTKNGYSLRQLFAYGRMLRRADYEIIHNHTNYSALFFAALFSRSTLVHTEHGGRLLRIDGIAVARDRMFMALLSPRISRVIANSDYIKRMLMHKLRIDEHHITTIHNGYATDSRLSDREQLRTQYNIPPNAQVIGVVSRLIPGKGIEFVIEAMKLLHAKGKPYLLAIIGDGQLREELERTAADEIHSGVIRFYGPQPNASELYTMFDLFCFPSTHDAFGLTLLEAMHARVPIVAFKVSAVPEIIEHDWNGYLLDNPDAAQLADGIEHVLDNPDIRLRFASNGQAQLAARYSLDHMCEKLESMYLEVSPN